MNHFGHDHPLILDENPEGDEDELSCYGCKQPISGPSYGCKRCWFGATTTNGSSLSPRAPPCPSGELTSWLWRNLYTKHKDEAVSKPKNSDPTKDLSPVHLPMPDESTDLTTLFIKNMTQQGNYSSQAEIIHNRPGHTVNFYQKEIKEEEKEDGQCQVCHQTICSPCYKCDQCNFSVHQRCAELPKELTQFPGHLEQHPLFVMNQEPTEFFECKCCGLCSNTCFFGCSECDFYLDARCASLPRTIKHKSHKHTLALRLLEGNYCCACGERDHLFGFVCEGCNYNLCIGCALVPRTIKYRYSDHPFTLIYDISVIDKVDNEYYCEICEEEIEPKYWFYLCKDCDQSVHLKCIPPAWWRFDIIKNRTMAKFALQGIRRIRHPLQLVISLAANGHLTKQL